MTSISMQAQAPPRLVKPERAIELARSLIEASDADETEVVIESRAERFVRYADVGPTQSADRERVVVAVRARLVSAGGWREARAECDGLDPEAAHAALGRALELARLSPPDAELAALGGPVEVPASEADEATLSHSFAQKAEWVRAALAACARHDLQPAGLVTTSGQGRILVNSAGREVVGARSRASFSLTATSAAGAGGAGFAQILRARAGDLDVPAAIERAVRKAVANRAPEPIEPGEYPVLLEPAAVSSLLLFASYHGFGAQDVAEQSSFLCEQAGKPCFSKLLTVSDDAANALQPGFAFDGEGTPRQRVVLIERGTPTGPVTDRRWAAKLGIANTGHARLQPCPEGPRADNLVVAAGDQSGEQLLAGLERGLLVTQFHYTNLIDPRSLLLTGMTRNGTFWVEHGRIVRAVRNLRFTDSLLRAFAGIEAVGREQEVAGALFDGEVVSPALRLAGLRFTSTTDF